MNRARLRPSPARPIALAAMLLAAALVGGCGSDPAQDAPGPKEHGEPGPIERALRGEEPTAPAERPTAELRPRPEADARTAAARTAAPSAEAPSADLPSADAPTAEPRLAAPTVTITREPLFPEGESDAAAPASDVSLARVVVAREIAHREPLSGPITADAERAFVFLEARNDGDAPTALAVEWIEPDGTVGQPIELEVPPSSRWRTWATTRRVHGRAGAWAVRVRAGERELARESFTVRAPAGPAAS